MSYVARIAIGEHVGWAENARDQTTACTDLVSRRPLPRPLDRPTLGARLAELRELITMVDRAPRER